MVCLDYTWIFLCFVFNRATKIIIFFSRYIRGDHFRFGLVFIKKNNQTGFKKKKLKPNWNRFKPTSFGQFGYVRKKTGSNQFFFPVWLSFVFRFCSVFFGLGLGWFGFFNFRLIKPKPNIEHHYQVDIFTAIIDQQLQKLNNIFNRQTIELLRLSTTLDPRNSYKLFNVEDIYLLVDKFYFKFFLPRKNSFKTSIAAL